MRFVLLLLAFAAVGCGGGPASAVSSDAPVVADAGGDGPVPEKDGGTEAGPLAEAGPEPDAAPICEYTPSEPVLKTNDDCLSDDPAPNNLCPCDAGYRYHCGDPATLSSPSNVQGCSVLKLGAEVMMCCTQLAGTRVSSYDSACAAEAGFPKGFYYPVGVLAPMGVCQKRNGFTCCQ